MEPVSDSSLEGGLVLEEVGGGASGLGCPLRRHQLRLLRRGAVV